MDCTIAIGTLSADARLSENLMKELASNELITLEDSDASATQNNAGQSVTSAPVVVRNSSRVYTDWHNDLSNTSDEDSDSE